MIINRFRSSCVSLDRVRRRWLFILSWVTTKCFIIKVSWRRRRIWWIKLMLSWIRLWSLLQHQLRFLGFSSRFLSSRCRSSRKTRKFSLWIKLISNYNLKSFRCLILTIFSSNSFMSYKKRLRCWETFIKSLNKLSLFKWVLKITN